VLYPHYIQMDESRLANLLEEQFPSLGSMLYLNHAAISPWPRVARDAVSAFARENCEQGPLKGGQWLVRETELRKRLAILMNAGSGDDIALVQNTSSGICVVANGVPWQKGDNVVTPENEFVSNQMPWDALCAQGVEIRRVSLRQAEDPEGALLSAVDRKTRVLTVSSVAWEDGFRLDLERLGAGCEGGSCLFFVDAIQQLGALPIDVSTSRIDALAAGSHKWQMGPEGMAVFYCNARWREKLCLSQYGWRMLDQPYRFDRPDGEPSATARRFEPGSPNTLGQVALCASLALSQDVGHERVGRRILGNTDYLLTGLQAMPGVEITSDQAPTRRSGIVSFRPAGGDVASLRRFLSKQGIYGAVRGRSFRVSPHYYQGPRQLERLLRAVSEFS